MQQINHWPDMAELSLPEAVSRDLHKQLLEPFDSLKLGVKSCNQAFPLSVFLIARLTVE